MSTRAVNRISAIAIDRTIKKYLGLPQDDNLSYIKVCDTDSVYATLEDLVNKMQPADPIEFCRKFSTEILLPEILKLEKQFLDGLNTIDASLMKFDNEIIASSLITVAAKRYFGKIAVKDGVRLEKPKIKPVGISLVSKSTPQGVRDILKPTLDIFLEKDREFILNYLAEKFEVFRYLPIKGIAGLSGVNNLNYTPCFDKTAVTDWKHANKFRMYNKENAKFLTAPLNSAGSIVHNYLIKEHNLMGKYEEIDESNKISVVYLQVPNPITFNHKAIAFKDQAVLDDLGLVKYIDRDTQWNKEVINKLQIIANAVNWDIEETPDALDEW